MAKSKVKLTWSRLFTDLTNKQTGLNPAPNTVLPDVLLTTPLPDAVDNLQKKTAQEQVSSSNTLKSNRTKRYAEMTTPKSQELLAIAPVAAPVISSFMSKLLRLMAKAIINRQSTSDDHKHRIINSFIPAAIRTTKLAGSQAAMNIKRALDSKQYDCNKLTRSTHQRYRRP